VTKFVEIRVRNARTNADARKVTETVAKSLLVKCSFNGSAPNNLMSSFLSDTVKACESLLRRYGPTFMLRGGGIGGSGSERKARSDGQKARAGRVLPPAKKLEIKRRYENTNPVKRIEDIARDMGIKPVSVYNVASKMGCKRPYQCTKLAGRKRKA